jgi:hypothetical protein
MNPKFYFFVLDDQIGSIKELKDHITFAFGPDITLGAKTYTVVVKQATTLEDCKSLLAQQEFLNTGGIVILDLAFDDNWPENPDQFSLKMIQALKADLKLDTLPYAIIYRSAFARNLVFEILENKVNDNEYLGLMAKSSLNGVNEQDQLKGLVHKFESNFEDIGNGRWRKRSNPLKDTWLKKFQLEAIIAPQQFLKKPIEENALTYFEKTLPYLTRTPQNGAVNTYRWNEILAIERLNLKDYNTVLWIIYPSAANMAPFFATEISFNIHGNTLADTWEEHAILLGKEGGLKTKIDLNDIWSNYNPAKIEQRDAIMDMLEKEALPFLRIHDSFILSLTFFEGIVTDKDMPGEIHRNYPCFKWHSDKPSEKHPHRIGYAKMNNGRDEIIYFPISGGHDRNRGIYTGKHQKEILAESLRLYKDWYSHLRRR